MKNASYLIGRRSRVLATFAAASLATAATVNAAVILDNTSRGRMIQPGSTSTTLNLGAGTGTSDGGNRQRSTFNFTVTDYLADIAAAPQILFTITPTGYLGTPTDLILVALDADDNSVTSADFGSSGTTVGTISFAAVQAAISSGTTISFDVTSFVKADALAGGTDVYSSFRLQTADAPSSQANLYQFGSPSATNGQLQLIPEPSSLALVSLAGLGLLRRKRA